MYGHKSFLRLGPLEDSSIQGLFKESFEMSSCSYRFSQGVDANGKAQTDVHGGTIYATYPNVPPADMIEWALKSNIYKDGAIVICDSDDMPLEKVKFENAACISMEISYIQKGKASSITKFTIQAKSISVGSTKLENRWPGFNK